MRLSVRVSPLLKIILPLCLLLVLRPLPYSTAVERGLSQSRTAQEESYPAAAAHGLRQAVQREPWRTDLWEHIGRAEYAAGRSREALEALQTALDRNSLSIEGRFLMGEIAYQAGDTSAAEAAWPAVISDAQNNQQPDTALLAQAYERMLTIHTARGDFDAAVGLLNAWNASPARGARSAYLLGLYLSVTAPDAAEPPLLDAARQDPAYSARVQLMRRGLAQYLVADQPAYGWLMIGRSLGTVNEWALAENAFNQAIELAPHYAEAWAFLSEARAHTGGSGRPEIEKALALAPQSTVVNALYALSLRRQARYAEALEYLTAVAQQEPEEPFWQVEIAGVHAQKGDLTAARGAFETAVKLSPQNATYWQALAQFCVNYNMDIRGTGLPAAREAVKLAPEDPSALDVMGWTLANLDDSVTGERFLQQALEIDADHVSANLHLGQIYLSRQDLDQAGVFLRRAARQAEIGSTEAETARRLLQQYFGETQ